MTVECMKMTHPSELVDEPLPNLFSVSLLFLTPLTPPLQLLLAAPSKRRFSVSQKISRQIPTYLSGDKS